VGEYLVEKAAFGPSVEAWGKELKKTVVGRK
jgi:hypothetical protein